MEDIDELEKYKGNLIREVHEVEYKNNELRIELEDKDDHILTLQRFLNSLLLNMPIDIVDNTTYYYDIAKAIQARLDRLEGLDK